MHAAGNEAADEVAKQAHDDVTQDSPRKKGLLADTVPQPSVRDTKAPAYCARSVCCVIPHDMQSSISHVSQMVNGQSKAAQNAQAFLEKFEPEAAANFDQVFHGTHTPAYITPATTKVLIARKLRVCSAPLMASHGLEDCRQPMQFGLTMVES